jgi:hypothetical protein
MLVYVYDNIMSDKGWHSDNRIGIKFIDAMNILSDMNLVKKVEDNWIAQSGAREYIKKIFPIHTNRNDAKKDTTLKAFDTPRYPISRIPYDIFDFEYVTNKNIKRQFSGDVYLQINKWLARYQRNQYTSIDNKLVKYAGAEGDLFKTADEYLYRGIVLNKEGNENLKEGDFIFDNRLSWTSDEDIAERFAVGNTSWLGNSTLGLNEIGLVLRHKFMPNEIFMDLNWVSETHPEISVDFSEEHEVIVLPRKRKVEIYRVLLP